MKLDKKALRLYAVTDRYWLNGRNLEDDVKEAILGGASIIQLREKNVTHEEFVSIGKKVQKVCKEYNVPFIINDDVEVMLELDADGIHVGQSDMVADNVRRLIGPNKILGVSAQTVEEALLAERMGADYLGVGAVFSTSTKLDAIDVSLDELTRICNSVKIPVVAIGGITKDNIKDLKCTMIDGIAVVSAIFAKDNIKEASRDLLNRVNDIIFDYPKKKLYIVDYDGTILDSIPLWQHIMSTYIKSIGFIPTDTIDKESESMTSYEAACYLKDKYLNNLSVEDILKDMDLFVANEYKAISPRAGAKELLMKLDGRVVLFSATSKCLLLDSLKAQNIDKYFDEVYSASDLNSTKRDGSGYLEIIAREGYKNEDTIIIEDAPYAVVGAKNANVTTVAIAYMSNENEIDTIRNNADYYLNLEKETL